MLYNSFWYGVSHSWAVFLWHLHLVVHGEVLQPLYIETMILLCKLLLGQINVKSCIEHVDLHKREKKKGWMENWVKKKMLWEEKKKKGQAQLKGVYRVFPVFVHIFTPVETFQVCDIVHSGSLNKFLTEMNYSQYYYIGVMPSSTF